MQIASETGFMVQGTIEEQWADNAEMEALGGFMPECNGRGYESLSRLSKLWDKKISSGYFKDHLKLYFNPSHCDSKPPAAVQSTISSRTSAHSASGGGSSVDWKSRLPDGEAVGSSHMISSWL